MHLGALYVILLLGTQCSLQELLLTTLQEGQLLLGCRWGSFSGSQVGLGSQGRWGTYPWWMYPWELLCLLGLVLMRAL